jgi:signal transduction histidine kinase
MMSDSTGARGKRGWLADEVELLAEVAERLAPHTEELVAAWTDELCRQVGEPISGSAEARQRITEVNRWFLERHFAGLRERDIDRVLAENFEGNLALLTSQRDLDPKLRSDLDELYLSLEISSAVIFERIRELFAADPRLGRALTLYARLSLQLAERVGSAFHQVRSEALQRALRTVSSLLQASRALNRPPASVNAVLADLASIIRDVVPCDQSIVFLWRETENAYVAEAGLGLPDDRLAEIRRLRFRRGDFPLMDSILDGRVVTGSRDDGNVPRDLMEWAGQVGYAVAPIASSRNKPLGTLAAYRADATPFDGTDLEILRGVAQNAALAIENTMLVEKLQSDLAERLRVQAELAQARDAALESVRLKSAFLANVSHEIRTPLNIITGYNDLIAHRFEELGDDSQRETLEAVERASRRLIRTVQSILDMSRFETSTFETNPTQVALAPLVEQITREFRQFAEAKGIVLTCEIADPDGAVEFDEYCLSQALVNLVDNAIKFTERGAVIVRLRPDAGGKPCLEVRDTGIGIDKQYRSKLFERFSQEESGYGRRFEGSGLGLALVKHYLDLNGASLAVETEKHKGSRFTIYFRHPGTATATGGRR